MVFKFPPNFDSLPVEDQIIVTEEIYRLRLIGEWGYMPGDPRLKSSDKIVDVEKD